MSALRTFSTAALQPCRRIATPRIAAVVSQKRGYAAGPKKPRRIEEYAYKPMKDKDEDDWEYSQYQSEFDDISSIAHGQLDQHREVRKYARIAVYEMPQLFELAKPFEPPTSATPLRFRYTSYLGEEHPAARKVIVEFTPGDLDLTEKQQIKLIKLVRSRYNPETDTIKISCERYEHPAQNKKWLSDRVDLLIGEARNNTDTFEDVPLDFRHWKPKKKPRFTMPEEWVEIAKKKEAQRLERKSASEAVPLSS